jgi:O-acetyl-ADP-ribose deacetylase (regulator of RNase III)
MTEVRVVEGDLLAQDVAVIVNAWNRNVIPWWLLLPQGVSGAIKKHGGLAPFREIARHGPMPLGSAVLTGAGTLPFEGIIHVAGINLAWRSSERSIRDSARNAMQIVNERGFASVAFPVIGAGSGGMGEGRASDILRDELSRLPTAAEVRIVRYRKGGA